MQDRRYAPLAWQLPLCPPRPRRFAAPSRIFIGCLLLLVAHSNVAQGPTTPSGVIRTDKADLQSPVNQPPDAIAQLRARVHRAKQRNFDAANELRIRQIADETGKLLILARDLQLQMEKFDGKPLPALLIREAEVIELLAHDVQSKMTLTIGAG
ncbi:MAG: hypothetical protein WBV28_05155 [Terracidiphilus sp.]